MFKLLRFVMAVSFINIAWASPMLEIKNEKELNQYLKEAKFNGVALVARNYEILYKESFGVRDFKSNRPLTVDDQFLIGSVTKQFVAASLLKLQEQGKISIDGKVSKYLPEYELFSGITIRDLLNHTSGIANFTDIPAFWDTVTYEDGKSLDDIIKFITTYPFDFEAKSNWKYSNTGYVIAGKILEVVSHKSWDQFIYDEFLLPLKMKDTGYNQFYENVTDVEGYVTGSNGELVSIEKQFNLTWALSAGALYSTVDDLLKWTAIYDESDLLNSASKKEMQTPFKRNYGLGINVRPLKKGIEISHGGRVPGFVSNLNYLSESKLKVITLDNTDGRFPLTADVLMEFYSIGKVSAVKLDNFPVSAESLQDYVGSYQLGSKLELNIIIKNSQLYLQPNDGQPAYSLVPNDIDSFRLMPLYLGEEFIRDAQGEIIGLNHYQNGTISYAAKKSSKSRGPIRVQTISTKFKIL